MRELFERRLAQRQREEVLIEVSTDGYENWVDLQDWLDRVLVVPVDEFLTVGEFKQRYAPISKAQAGSGATNSPPPPPGDPSLSSSGGI